MKLDPRSLSPAASILLLAAVAACAPTDSPGPSTADAPGGTAPLDWSSVVGPDYARRAACQATIDGKLTLDGAALPVPPDAVAGADNLACEWDVFAWNSFAALNWPANTEVGKRGLAATGVTFLDNRDAAAEVVWESFKEKRELFQEVPSPHWNDIDGGQEVKRFKKPKNLWTKNGGYCTPEDQRRAATAASGPFAANKFHNQLDETAEVQSQALEPLSELCMGKTKTGTNPNGEPECGINNQSVVGPRVWMGTATAGRPLYYEVKVNYDFFDYVMHPPSGMALPSAGATLVDDEVAATNAMLANIRLPWRTEAPASGTANQNAVFGYGSDGCDPTVGRPETGVTGASVPCRAGAVHMKAAWVRLGEAELAEVPPRFHTTTALFYETPAAGKTCIAVDTFGLVGVHAIQRVKTRKLEEKTDPKTGVTTVEVVPSNPGGAFIFATWEHRSILDPTYERPQEFQYVNLLTNPAFGSTEAGAPFPALEDALPVKRMIPTGGDASATTTCGLSAEQTCQVNAAALELLQGSVWSNYRLVGTQFAPNDCAFTEGSRTSEAEQLAKCRYDTLSTLGQPHFLANAVIETNQGLQHFLGLPPQQPRLQPSTWCESAENLCDNQGRRKIGPNTKQTALGSVFDRGTHNMTYGGKPVNMGGCQGCHGIAQQNGYSFSFVLLDGVDGAGADTEQAADVPATAISQSVPVRLRSTSDATKYLAITGKSRTYQGFYDVGLADRAAAAAWRLRPYTTNPGVGNFGGQIVVADTAGRGILTLGRAGQAGSDTSVLVGPTQGGGISRAPRNQTVYLVEYKGDGPDGKKPVATYPYSLVSAATTRDASGEIQYVLTGDPATDTASAARPVAAGSADILEQVFDIEVVPAGGSPGGGR